jgi:predicted TIM-barrel fold metal-dependent hydrolase
MKRIDAHAHVYSNDDVRYPTIKNPVRPPGMSGSFSSLKRLAYENDVSRICIIQPSSYYGWDNRFICDLALAEPCNTAAICTPNPEDRSSPSLVTCLMKQYGIRGIRSLPASDGRIDHPGVRDLWRTCVDNDITVNVCIKSDRAYELTRLLDDFPGVQCVIDHCLLLAAEPTVEETLTAMLGLAQYPNTFAKLSSLPNCNAEEYPYSRLHEPYRRIIAGYTPSRCVWGSNFPCELWTPQSTYRQNLELFTSRLGLDTQAQEDIFWNTPWRLWFKGK